MGDLSVVGALVISDDNSGTTVDTTLMPSYMRSIAVRTTAIMGYNGPASSVDTAYINTASISSIDSLNSITGQNGISISFSDDTGTVFSGSDIAIIGAASQSGSPYDQTSSADLYVQGMVVAQSFNATSDKRLKENLRKLKVEKSILDLPLYRYDFIHGEKNQIGCMAQDLQELYPELVEENKYGYLSIKESKLIYLLMDEVKKLKEEIEKLKK
jgi:hypothetical protein